VRQHLLVSRQAVERGETPVMTGEQLVVRQAEVGEASERGDRLVRLSGGGVGTRERLERSGRAVQEM
jgi:hypothetical protein